MAQLHCFVLQLDCFVLPLDCLVCIQATSFMSLKASSLLRGQIVGLDNSLGSLFRANPLPVSYQCALPVREFT